MNNHAKDSDKSAQQIADELDSLRTRIEQLKESEAASAEANKVLSEAYGALQGMFEELQVAQEELHTQNDELMAAHRLLEAERRHYGELFHHAPALYLITDLTGKIKDANEAAAKALNLGQVTLKGRTLNYFLEADGRNVFLSMIKDLSDSMHVQTCDLSIKPHKLEPFFARVAAAPALDANNKLEGVRWLIVDISERKRIEETADRARVFFESIVETVRHPLVVLDAGLRVFSVNPAFCRTFGTAKQDTEGRLLYELGNGQWDIPKLRMLLKEVLSHHSYFADFEVEHDFPGIGHRIVILNARQLSYEDSGNNLILLAIEDMTERRLSERRLERLNEELRRSNAELEQFAYVASHDLQEPLRMVSSYMQLIEKRYKGKLDKDADEFIGYAVDGAYRMKALIQSLLDYSRVQTRGKAFKEVDTEQLLEKVVKNLEFVIEDNKVRVTHDPLPVVRGDDSQLGAVFQNLIENAIKFRRDEPPRIHISAEEKDGEWAFSVKDNGIGIDRKYWDRIFLIFQRLHGVNTPGTGIGLTLCRRIIERHGGRIWLESQPGEGSTFRFTIATGGQEACETTR